MDEIKLPAVSVIIPMYNAEKYLEECLTSLVNQTLKNIEIILVDDCSNDNSLEIAKNFIPKFEAEDKNFVIIKLTQRSGCPGIPRNVAINLAKGKYIFFLDSDDFLDENALADFYEVAEKFNVDVVHAEKCFKCREIDGEFVDQIHLLETAAATEKPTLETFDIAKRVSDFVEKKYHHMIWSKFFRREFLIENNINFPALTITEDFIFSLMCLACAKNYVRVPFAGYHYRKHADSATASPRHSTQISLDLIEGVYILNNFMQNQKFFVENPKYCYLTIDYFNRMFAGLISKHIFFTLNLDPGEIYDFYCKNVFSLNPQKNIPLTAYLFVSTNIYKMLVKQQAAEIAELKKLLQDKQ